MQLATTGLAWNELATVGALLLARTLLIEMRWWLALRGSPPAHRPAIISALHAKSTTPRPARRRR